MAFALAGALSIPASAQSQMGGANQEYMKSMERMDADMKKDMDPDPTKAWAKMMVAHHQGAIEMSQTVLKETKDTTIREMAQKAVTTARTGDDRAALRLLFDCMVRPRSRLDSVRCLRPV
ncbi:MAG: DUF305 domain-containing protein [Rhizobiales bacterium]|nr:DUF305 domain-containing protein [Hyphomicrobiales bacterium]